MQAAVVRAASTPQRFDGATSASAQAEAQAEAAVQQPTAAASGSTSGRRKLARKRARSEEEQDDVGPVGRLATSTSSRSTSTSPTTSTRRRRNLKPSGEALRQGQDDLQEVEVEGGEGSEEGETASPAAAADDGEAEVEGEGDDASSSSSGATTLRRRRGGVVAAGGGGGGATTARRKAQTSRGAPRSTSPPTSTSSRRRQRVQQQQQQQEGAEGAPEAVQDEETTMKQVEAEEDEHAAAATTTPTPPPVVSEEEEEGEGEAEESKQEESGEAEPDHQPRHGDSGASSAATHEATASGEEAENEGEGEEQEELEAEEAEDEKEEEEVESAEDGGVEDAVRDEQESDVVDGELPDHEEEAAVNAKEEDEERMDMGGSEDDASHDAAGSSAMDEVETQSNGAVMVSPTKNEDEASSSPAVVAKNVSPRGTPAATRAANDAQAAAGAATQQKKADEKSASPPSQYATRRRTRGMTQEKEKEKEKEKANGDFITGQDEVDQYILGSKSNSASPSKDSQTVGPVLYKPGEEFRGLKKHVGKRLVVHIDAKHITTTNDQVSERQIWGNTGYTADSDLICVLLHTGSLKTISAEPPDYFGIALYMHILPGRDSYIGTKRGTMRSRNWSEHDVTLKLDRFEVLPVKPDDWASAEQVDGAKMKTKKKKSKTSTEESVKRKRRRKEANDKQQLENGVAVDNKDEAAEANDDAASTSRSGGRTRRSRTRVGVRSNKEEQQQPSLASALQLKKEQLATPALATPAPSTSSGPVGMDLVKQEPQLDDMEAEADEEAAAEQAIITTTTTTTATSSRVNTRSGRQPPPAAAPRKRVRRRPASGAKPSRSSRQTQQPPTAGAGNWEGGRGVSGSDEWDADPMGSRMREDDSTDAPLADESDSDDSVQGGKKRAKIAGNMKLLEKIARLDRWMPLPTDVMRYNLSYEPCYHYTLGMLADRGFESDFWFSTRLRSFTLYLENDSQRFEFSYSGEVTQVEPSVDALLGSEALSFLSFFSPTRMPNTEPSTEVTCLRPGGHNRRPVRSPKDEALLEAEKHNRIRVAYGHYRWAEVRHPFSMDRAELKRVGVPLPNDSGDISVLAGELTWEEVAWGEGSVCVRGTTYPLHSLFWMPRSRIGTADGADD